jgi:hypothetical protein
MSSSAQPPDRWLRVLRRPTAPRPVTGQVLHSLLDTGDVPLDVLHIQPASDNLTVSDLEQRHPTHLKGLPVAAGTRPAPFAPGRITVPDRPADLGAEAGDPANMASQLASIWARPAKALPGCTGCSLR